MVRDIFRVELGPLSFASLMISLVPSVLTRNHKGVFLFCGTVCISKDWLWARSIIRFHVSSACKVFFPLLTGLNHFRFRSHWLVGLLLQGRIDIGLYFRATLVRSSPIDVYGGDRRNRQLQTLPTGIIHMITIHDIVQPTYLAVKNIRLSLHRCLRSLVIP
ncbi:hypothetical protein D3C81_1098820 [compost metagenome]